MAAPDALLLYDLTSHTMEQVADTAAGLDGAALLALLRARLGGAGGGSGAAQPGADVEAAAAAAAAAAAGAAGMAGAGNASQWSCRRLPGTPSSADTQA